MILVEFTINSVLHRLSREGIALAHWWDMKVMAMSSPRRSIPEAYGGYCKMVFGDITLSPDLFTVIDWPPPLSCPIEILYTETTEEAAETLFSGTAHLSSVERDAIVYDLYAPNDDVDLLDEGADYNGDTVPFPRAFGAVEHQNPVRVADVGGQPTYHKAYIQGVIGTDWHVYDDGVNIDSNVSDNGSTFSLSASPVGEVTISGTGEDTTLSEVFSWACGSGYLNLTYNSAKAESPSPSLAYWAGSQMLMMDFLSEIAAFFTHMFYVSGSTLYLLDMAEDNGSQTFTEFDFFPATYEYNSPVGTVRSEWTIRSAVSDSTGNHIAESEDEAVTESLYAYGGEISLSPYCNDLSVVKAQQASILSYVHAVRPHLSTPLVAGSIPVPGMKVSFTDDSQGQSVSGWMRIRSIVYDFDTEEISLEGDGAIS